MSKILKFLSVLFVAMFSAISFSSCEDTVEPKKDPADVVAGTYAGSLSINNITDDDAYYVIIKKLTSDRVIATDKERYIFGDEGSSYVVKEENGRYILSNINDGYSNISVIGNTITISYTSMTGNFINFAGKK